MLNTNELKQAAGHLQAAGHINNLNLYVETEDGQILEICGITAKNGKLILKPEIILRR